jgi:hypothetical protein
MSFGPIICTNFYPLKQDDLEKRVKLLAPLRKRGIMTGLEIKVSEWKKFDQKRVEKLIRSITPYLGRDNICKINFHSPNRPLEETNFLLSPDTAESGVKKSIDFLDKIPEEYRGGVNFHLNTLVSPNEWMCDYSYWKEIFAEKIAPRLKEIFSYGNQKGVGVRVETMPIPEFGNLADLEEGIYNLDLGDPYPIFPWRIEKEIRRLGGNITLDVCHASIALKALKECDRILKEGKDPFSVYKGIFLEDLAEERTSLDKYSESSKYVGRRLVDFIAALRKGDSVHLSSSKGIYRPPQGHYIEGLAIDSGDLGKYMPEIIKALSKFRDTVIIEVEDSDLMNLSESKRSVEFLISTLKQEIRED